MNPELTDYITSQLKKGVTKEEIFQALSAKGWPHDIIMEAFGKLSPNTAIISTPTTTLLGPVDLFKASILLLQQHIWPILALSLAPAVIGFLVAFFSVLVTLIGVAGLKLPPSVAVITLILIIILFIALLFFGLWCQTALYTLIATKDEKLSMKEALRRSSRKYLSFGWIMFLSGLIISGGFVLFIIPGLFYMVWYGLAPFALIVDDTKGMDALLTSREYVRGYGMAVFWRLVFSFLAAAVVSIVISVIGKALLPENARGLLSSVVNVLLTPYYIAYGFLIFDNLRSIKGPQLVRTGMKRKIMYLIVGIVGVTLILAIGYAILNAIYNTKQNTSSTVTPINTGIEIKPLINPSKMLQEANDTKRVNDIEAVQNALKQMKEDNPLKPYPSTLTDPIFNDYLFQKPIDPLTSKPYEYTVLDNGNEYLLCATFESTVYKKNIGHVCFSSTKLISHER